MNQLQVAIAAANGPQFSDFDIDCKLWHAYHTKFHWLWHWLYIHQTSRLLARVAQVAPQFITMLINQSIN